MSLWKYKYFVDVVDSKSFTKAGIKNYVTQTAISQQISSLEKSVGGKLIERGNGKIYLTELGQVVYDRAREMLELNDQMFQEIEELKEKYEIRIGIDSSINKLFWLKMQELMDQHYSENELRFSKVDSYIGSKMLKENSLDIYVGYGMDHPDKNEEIEELEVSRNRIGIYYGINSSLRKISDFTVKDLERYTRYGTQSYLCSMQDGESEEFRLISHGIERIDNVDTMKLKVEFNDGYALADSYYFSYCDGEIRTLPEYDATCVIKAFYKKKRNKRKVKQVLEELQHILTV
ncbi:LysR family transcriptional regulator [Bariatricus sp. SGI.154]|uniref:LysR family transcriptional regulator n=1 Tax=Bariatricus sp. SGI.154 TaxID=3420549 RepID=UPI003D041F06